MSGDDADVEKEKNAIVETVGGATGLGWAMGSAGGVAIASTEGAGLVGAAFGGGYLLGTGIDDLTGHSLSHHAEKAMEAVFGDPSHGDLTDVATPEGQTDTVNGTHGHWAHDSDTPDIDATFIPDE
jgi:hypothetical protein